ncbi:hypothetical protein MBLNU459_g1506t1 [Dothideomycetes sp. NU459]
MPFLVSEATLADVPAITSIFRADAPTSFMRLCLGSVHPSALNVKQSDRIADEMHEEDQLWLIARDAESGRTASFAQWRLPKEEPDDAAQDNAADLEEQREAYRDAISPGMNVDLVVEFQDQITKLRKETLKGQRHFLLMNLGTSSVWQRKGAASTLVEYPFDVADEEQIIVYLDTAIDGPGKHMYESLGFQHAGQCSIDLTQYGGEGVHTHVAMIRYPKS